MPALLTVAAPLTIRLPSGERHLMVERFAHSDGLLYFQPFWRADGTGIALARGPIRGEGPWKVGDCVVTVAGCAGTDPEIAMALARWQEHLLMQGSDYPSRLEIEAVARRHGATFDPSPFP